MNLEGKTRSELNHMMNYRINRVHDLIEEYYEIKAHKEKTPRSLKEWTMEDRDYVKYMIDIGMKQKNIAEALGVSLSSLEAYLFRSREQGEDI